MVRKSVAITSIPLAYRGAAYLVSSFEIESKKLVTVFDRGRWWRGLWNSEEFISFLEQKRNDLERLADFQKQALVGLRYHMPRVVHDLERIQTTLQRLLQTDFQEPVYLRADGPTSIWNQTDLYKEIQVLDDTFHLWVESAKQMLSSDRASPMMDTVGEKITEFSNIMMRVEMKNLGWLDSIIRFFRRIFGISGPTANRLQRRLFDVRDDNPAIWCHNISRELKLWSNELVAEDNPLSPRLAHFQWITASYRVFFRALRYRFEGRVAGWPDVALGDTEKPLWRWQRDEAHQEEIAALSSVKTPHLSAEQHKQRRRAPSPI